MTNRFGNQKIVGEIKETWRINSLLQTIPVMGRGNEEKGIMTHHRRRKQPGRGEKSLNPTLCQSRRLLAHREPEEKNRKFGREEKDKLTTLNSVGEDRERHRSHTNEKRGEGTNTEYI